MKSKKIYEYLYDIGLLEIKDINDFLIKILIQNIIYHYNNFLFLFHVFFQFKYSPSYFTFPLK